MLQQRGRAPKAIAVAVALPPALRMFGNKLWDGSFKPAKIKVWVPKPPKLAGSKLPVSNYTYAKGAASKLGLPTFGVLIMFAAAFRKMIDAVLNPVRSKKQ